MEHHLNVEMIINANIQILTPQEQSSERYLPGTIVPWRDIFDNDVMIPQEKFLSVGNMKKATKIPIGEKLKIFIRIGMISNRGVISIGKMKKIRNRHPTDGKDGTLKNWIKLKEGKRKKLKLQELEN